MLLRKLRRIFFLNSMTFRFAVAPHAGAWIETSILVSFPAEHQVAPHAGAWIETPFSDIISYD